MTQAEGTPLCPKGHLSTETDYCSECGARIAGSPTHALNEAFSVMGHAGSPGKICPDCGTLPEQPEIAFCEVCGFNFETGARGEIPIAAIPEKDENALIPPEPPSLSPPSAQPAASGDLLAIPSAETETVAAVLPWSLLVQVDPGLGMPESPSPPEDFQAFTVMLDRPVNLVGRVDEVRGIFPEVALTYDEAVSRRHALLQWDREHGDLQLRDIGASNGTRLNGTELVAMTDYPLQEGDEITLGHWTRLRIQRH